MNRPKVKKPIIGILLAFLMVFCLATPLMAKAYNYTNGDYQHVNDVVKIGDNINAEKRISGSAVAIFGNTKVHDGTDGDVVAILGNAEVKGNVNGSVVAVGGNITVDGNVNGDVVAIAGKVTLKGKSIINGQVVASSIEKDQEIVIRGDTVQTNIPNIRVPMINGGGIFSLYPLFVGFKAAKLLITFLILALMVALYPKGVEVIAQSAEKDTMRGLGIGIIATLLLFPITITVIGLPITLFLYASAKILGYAGVALFIGRKFIQNIKSQSGSMYLQILAGILLVGLVEIVPILGTFFGWAVFWLSMGAMLDTKFGTGRPWSKKA